MIFLVMTIALGVFNAQTASSININAVNNTRYLTGADVTLKEAWASNADQVENDPSLDLIYYEPDFGVYETMPGAASAAKVYRNANISIVVKGGSLKGVNLCAIDTQAFGNTAYFDETLLPTHWYNYLNAMAQNARAVILSKNFKTDYGYKIGDVINYSLSSSESVRGIIYGFVDYWPGYAPFTYKKGSDGIYRETANYLIVANLSQVQDDIGIRPYEVWLKNEDGADYIYDYAEEHSIRYMTFEDAQANIIEKKNDPMLKSLNGVLTVGFIVVLVLCFIGFLMYWILSIRQRTLEFGIYRAMGMSLREIISMLINEQFAISILSIAAGAVIGFIASSLYMPLIQIAYASSDNALPLINTVNLEATGQLFALVLTMLIICMAVLVAIIRKMKIAQALKLGED
ncbi:MAG: ABC transporter permease [Clostridia bacterium]|nr:ABC transporter permease [Clostridia bacterium]